MGFDGDTELCVENINNIDINEFKKCFDECISILNETGVVIFIDDFFDSEFTIGAYYYWEKKKINELYKKYNVKIISYVYERTIIETIES